MTPYRVKIAQFCISFAQQIVLSVLASIVFVVSTQMSTAQELALLEKMPSDLLRFTGGARPDEHGMVGYNRDGFKSPEFQRGAMHYMIRAIVRKDTRCIDEGWLAIDAAFRYQTENGGFSRKGTPHGGPSAVAFWLADLSQALLILRESELGPKYQTRIDHLMPKIGQAAQWLAQPRYQERLKREDAETPNRLLFDALAYGLSGILLNNAELKQIGQGFLDAAMARYRSCDGVFLEKGGADSSYQAVAALKLQIWAIHFPDKKLDNAINHAVEWERSRVKDDGEIEVAGNTRTGLGQEQWMGHDKGVNLSEVTLCLLYHYARTGDEQSLAAARRIVERRKKGV